jgi:hypothetical protein
MAHACAIPLCHFLLGYARRAQKSPHCTWIQWGLVFSLFYSFLFVLILIAFAIAILCRHSSLLL